MDVLDVAKVLRRIDDNFPPFRKPTEEQIKRRADEWERSFRYISYSEVDNAVSLWIDSNSRAPTISDIRNVCFDVQERRRMNSFDNWTAAETENRCPLCHGTGGAVLVDLPGNIYGSIALKHCPCQMPGVMPSLRNGQKVTVPIGKRGEDGRCKRPAKLRIWLDPDRKNLLLGEYLKLGGTSEAADVKPPEPQSKQASLFGMSDMTAAMTAEREDDLPF